MTLEVSEGHTMKYKLVSTKSATDLTEQVNALIAEGWQPLGGVALGGDALNRFFAQAMTKASRQ